MSIIQPKGVGGRYVAERTSFVGSSVPKEIKLMISSLKSVKRTTFLQILEVTVASLQKKEAEEKSIKFLQNLGAENEETIAVVFSGLHKLLTLALRTPKHLLKIELFKEDLAEIGFPQEAVGDLVTIITGPVRDKIDSVSSKSHPHYPQVDDVKWRVDVAISTSSLNRILEPTILMELSLSDGNNSQFEVPVSIFHMLRYNVAHLLKAMSDLEKRSILKIEDQS